MSLNEILTGLTVFLRGIFSGVESVLQILFATPEIAGASIGVWLLGFSVVGSVLYAMLGD